jgi:UDPglucose 6-dehydrogenase
VAGKRVAVFGFSFKANTGDTRDSPAIRVCRQLHAERAAVVVTDPQGLDNAARELADLGDSIEYELDPYRAAQGAHAILILTEWDLYRGLDYARIYAAMEKPAFIFDGRGILDVAVLRELGIHLYAIGKPTAPVDE